jgi:hypothetical protein
MTFTPFYPQPFCKKRRNSKNPKVFSSLSILFIFSQCIALLNTFIAQHPEIAVNSSLVLAQMHINRGDVIPAIKILTGMFLFSFSVINFVIVFMF